MKAHPNHLVSFVVASAVGTIIFALATNFSTDPLQAGYDVLNAVLTGISSIFFYNAMMKKKVEWGYIGANYLACTAIALLVMIGWRVWITKTSPPLEELWKVFVGLTTAFMGGIVIAFAYDSLMKLKKQKSRIREANNRSLLVRTGRRGLIHKKTRQN